VLGILNLLGIGIVFEGGGEGRAGHGYWTGRTRERGKREGRSRTSKAGLIGAVAGAAAVLALTVVLIVVLGRRGPAKDAEKVRADDKKSPINGPGKENPPAVPVKWEAHPDPAPKPAEPLAFPAGLRIPAPGEFIFASGGPFLALVDPAAKQAATIWDLRTGKPAGTLPARALNIQSRLSADGKSAAALLAEHSGGSSFVEIWRAGTDKPAARLTVPGHVLWMDFGATDEELVFLTRSDAKDVKDARDQLQFWSVSKGQAARVLDLPTAASPPRRPNVGPIPGALSPGKKYLALLGSQQVALLALADCRLLAELPLTDPGDLVSGMGLWFSEDGAELTGIFNCYQGVQAKPRRLKAWKMADGTAFADVALGTYDFSGPVLRGPGPGTVILKGTILKAGRFIRQGQVIELKSGVALHQFPFFVPLRWLDGDRLLGYDVAADTSRPRFLQSIAFDREKLKAATGPVLTPRGPKP
jgi:hypothetical protein